MNSEKPLPSAERQSGVSSAGEAGEVDLVLILGVLAQARWFILGAVLTALALSVVYVYTATPVYSVDAMVQIEARDSAMKGMGALSDLFGGNNTAESEIEILKSRAVAGAVVDQLRLDIIAEPRTFPLIGWAMARRYKGVLPANPPYGFVSYAWGGEVIRVDTLAVPDELYNKELTLVALGEGAYRVSDKEGNTLFSGREGQAATGHGIALFVSRLIARPSTEFVLIKQSRILATVGLQKSLSILEKGRKTGILALTLEGSDPKHTAEVVNALADNYLRQNVERRSEEAQKMLDFLNSELPRVRVDARNAEAALSAYRSHTATLGTSFASQAYVQSSAEVEKQIALLGFEKAEMEQRFTGDSPALLAVRKKLAQMEAEKKKLMDNLKRLPGTELEAINLERDAKVANEVYTLLLNKVQELSVAKAGTIGNVRIVDRADTPVVPIKPKKALILASSVVLGLFAGVVLVMARRAFFKVVEEPDEVERALGLTVYATIPHSGKLQSKGKRRYQERILLMRDFPKDVAAESVRSLRTSVQFSLMESPNNVVGLTGPSIAVGKTFVSVNLAVSLAEAGKRVLLIDADMRKGYLHEYFSLARTDGLSRLVSGEISIEAAIHHTGIEKFDVMPSGAVPPNPAEILMSERFEQVVKEVSGRYDVVIIDTPPVLAVADACIISRCVGILFLVVRCARHSMREIDHSYRRLKQDGARVRGVIFNDTPMTGRYGYRYGYGYGRYYGYGYGYGYGYDATK